MEEISYLKKICISLIGEEANDLTGLERYFKLQVHKKGNYFLKEDTRAQLIGFVVEGAFREFYTDNNGREYNKAFCFKGDFTGSYYDLYSGKPSIVSIQALVDSKVLVIRHTEYINLIRADTYYLRVAFQLSHNLLMKKLEKEYQLLTLSASKRFELLRKEQPELEQLVPAFHIASYLGITPVSFSRLKAKKK